MAILILMTSLTQMLYNVFSLCFDLVIAKLGSYDDDAEYIQPFDYRDHEKVVHGDLPNKREKNSKFI